MEHSVRWEKKELYGLLKHEGERVKRLGCVYERIPTSAIDEELFRKVIDEDLCSANHDEIINNTLKWCEKNFNVHDGVGNTSIAPNGNPYKTYAVSLSISSELLEDYSDNDIDLKHGFESCALMLLRGELEALRSTYDNKPVLYWRKTPDVAGGYYDAFSCCYNVFASMRPLIS